MRIALVALLLAPVLSYAQESLEPLLLEQDVYKERELKRSTADSDIVYLLDTIDLPFTDDFSKNKIKDIRLPASHPSVFDSINSLFQVDGLAVDSQSFMIDTVYYYFINGMGNPDTAAYPPFAIVFFDTSAGHIPIDTLYYWQTFSEHFQPTDTTITQHTPDTTLFNYADTCLYALDDGRNSLWINEGAFRNFSFGVDPPTIGVLTFDGVDRLGVPYDFSSAGTYGEADQITSKPINLGTKISGLPYTEFDSVYVSFQYQPQGVGDNPQPIDSLILEFYKPSEDEWQRVWAKAGDTLQPFEQVNIHIRDSSYLQKGFRIRFRNLATLSGSLDHWNIDYVNISDDQKVVKDILADVSFIGETPSYIKDYYSMPWEHFKGRAKIYVVDSIFLPMRNLSSIPRFVQNQFSILEQDSITPYYQSSVTTIPSFTGNSDVTIAHAIPEADKGSLFPKNTDERVAYVVKNSLETTPDDNQDNDTLVHLQVFDTYYAYDDGVAERAYSLNGAGAMLAYRFSSPELDTITALLVNFPQMLLNELGRRINIMVWDNLQDDPIYESGPVWEVEYPDLNGFHRYVLDEPVEVKGTFYVGWEQQDARKIYVGWDLNRRSEQHLFYNRDGTWNNSQFEGSLMLRPDFGEAQIFASTTEQPEEQPTLKVYPNPTNGLLNVVFEGDIRVFDMQGRMILSEYVSQEGIVDLSYQSPGAYIVIGFGQDGRTHQQKVLLH